jgi:hypothetical protein
VRKQISNLPKAHCCDEPAPGQRGHRDLISMLIELILTP